MNKAKALYIHIPFCGYICDYCDFTKLQYFRFLAEKYLISLKKEIANYQIGQLDTIFIGGGTPTILEDDLFEELLKTVEPYTKNVIEFTVEANPESLTINKIKLMNKYHVNRVSIGVESTNDKILVSINRHHSFSDVKTAIDNLKKHGISNINVDLILGLPNVTKKMLLDDINNVLTLDVPHISCYSLTVHEHTVFYNKNIKPRESDEERELYDLIDSVLYNNGYEHYEVSNFSKPGFNSLHNLTYWKNERYYGVGLGASGYLGNIRYTNTRNLSKYTEGDFIDYQEKVEIEDDIEYEIMLKLRTKYGLNLEEFVDKYNIDINKIKEKEISELIDSGLIIRHQDSLVATYEGMMLLDQIIYKLLP